MTVVPLLPVVRPPRPPSAPTPDTPRWYDGVLPPYPALAGGDP